MTPTEDVVTRSQLDRQSHFACCAAAQNRMLRGLGQRTRTCFQRCVGIDALNALMSVTFDLDRGNGAGYHDRFKDYCLAGKQRSNLVTGADRRFLNVC